MVRIVLGVIVGFIAWTIVWIGSDEAFASFSHGWYSTNKLALEKAVFNNTEFTADSTMLILHLVRSVIISILSGFLAVVVSNENRRTTIILGILLLVVGVYFEWTAWKQLPIWYHLVFLALLIPVTLVGGKLKKTT